MNSILPISSEKISLEMNIVRTTLKGHGKPADVAHC